MFAALGQAQEKTQGEQGQAQTEQAPAQTLPIPLPVDIVEDEATTEARKRREGEARQHEIDDLVAQRGMNAATQAMNEATQRMAVYSKWSTILVGIGTALLILTLWLTRQANKAAQDGVEQAREAGVQARRQADLQEESFKRLERPYVMPGAISKISQGPDTLVRQQGINYVCCEIGNYGRTPAIIHYVLDSFGPTPDNHHSDPDSGIRKLPRDFAKGSIMSADEVAENPFVARFPAAVSFKGKPGRLSPSYPDGDGVYLVINIKFEDVVGTIRIARFTWKWSGNYNSFLRFGGKTYNYEIEVEK